MALLFLKINIVHLLQKIKIALLYANKSLVEILREYAEYTNVFFWEIVAKLLKFTMINNHPINLEKNL